MTITTKFNVGEVVYFMHANQVTSRRVTNIQIFISLAFPEGKITYSVETTITDKLESEIFASKEELINSL